MRESEAIKKRLLSQAPNERLFRINAGMGYTGSSCKKTGNVMFIKNPFPLRAAPEGWHDICGWETVEITPEMVGQKIARFKFVEVKMTGKLSRLQNKFKELLESMGGIVEIITKKDAP